MPARKEVYLDTTHPLLAGMFFTAAFLIMSLFYKFNERDLVKANFSGNNRASDCRDRIPTRMWPEQPDKQASNCRVAIAG